MTDGPLPRVSPDRLVWLLLFFPQPLGEARALGLLRAWAAQHHAPQLICEARADAHGVEYLLGVQARHATAIRRGIEQLIPGAIVVAAATDDRGTITTARRLTVSSRTRPLEPSDHEASTRSILAALTTARPGERLVLQLVLGPRRHPQLPPADIPASQSLLSRLWQGTTPDRRSDTRQAVTRKLAVHGFIATIRLGVHAATEARRHSLLRQLVSALATVETAGVQLRLRPETAARVNQPRATWAFLTPGVHLSVPEVSYLTAWPITSRDEPLPGQPPRHPKPVRPSAALATGERIVGTATAPGTGSSVGYSVIDRMRHTWIIGPNGTGKSTLLLNLITQDLTDNLPVVVIEPKDLVTDLLARIPAHRQDDVVLLDPLDDAPVGINPLAKTDGDARSPELIADGLLATFEALYGEGLGPRSSDILRYCLGALALHDNASLVMLPLLLNNPAFRHSITKQAIARDPIGAGSFWAWYDSLSPEMTATVTAPLSNKLRPLLTPTLRAVLAQRSPAFTVRQVLTERKILLVPLQKGVLGSSAAQLLAAVVLSELWQAIRERVTIPEQQRIPLTVVIDEVQDFLRLPTDLADALATARSLRAGFTLAHQYGGQLPKTMLEAVKANARSRICFQLAAADAREMVAGQSVLTPEDFTHLAAYEIYAQLVRDNAVQPWASARTHPPAEPCSDPDDIRARSRNRYGRARTEIDADFQSLLDGTAAAAAPAASTASYGRKARRS